ncbi:hypothetical protein Trydic_g9309, partial [Trypoxylus dichotomus]
GQIGGSGGGGVPYNGGGDGGIQANIEGHKRVAVNGQIGGSGGGGVPYNGGGDGG